MVRCRRRLILTSVVAVAAFSLLAAGCGGGGSAGVASVASSTTAANATTQNGAVAFSRCMRSHGVPNFPDSSPPIGAHPPRLSLQQLGVSEAQFQAAKSACDHVVPNGGQPASTAGAPPVT